MHSAELVLLRVAPTPHRIDVSFLLGGRVDAAALERLGESLADLDPPDDIEVSGETASASQ